MGGGARVFEGEASPPTPSRLIPGGVEGGGIEGEQGRKGKGGEEGGGER